MKQPANNVPVVREVPGLPPRADNTHKGQVGRVVVLAGSRGMSGAACLAALGALRGGAGLVRVCTPASVQPIIAASEPCLMSVPLAEDARGRLAAAAAVEISESLKWADVAAVGPGLGQTGEIAGLVASVLTRFDGPVVLDADGLNSIATVANWWKPRAGRPTVLTPHPGEMARLRAGAGLADHPISTDEERREAAVEFSRLSGAVVVLKGHRTVVAAESVAYVNTSGNAGMATGGMGDVLTGFIAALLGQGIPPFDAARLGAYAHGVAADLCAERIGPIGYLARDVAELLPAALAQASRPRIGYK